MSSITLDDEKWTKGEYCMAFECMLQQDISKAKLEQRKVITKIAKEKNKNKLKKLQYRLDGIEDYIYSKGHPEDF